MAESSASIGVATRSPSSARPAAAEPVPKALNRTFASERFIARHMMPVRMSPEAPTSAPEMMRALFSSTNPADAAASPE